MKLRFSKIVYMILILGLISQVHAQNFGTISGTVKDLETGESIFGANIYLKGTHMGSASDVEGKYVIEHVPAGKWVLVCSIITYTKIEQEITIEESANLNVDFSLKEDELKFSDVVVTATRNMELVTSIPVATEVLNSKKIEESNAKDVGEALKSVGALLVKSYGGLGSLESVSLRGSTNAQVLILIDGQRLNNAQDGSVDLSSIPLDAVEKIEVVKGGNSAMYGSDAVGGVINIITKSMARKNKLDFSLNGMYGTYNTQAYDVSVGQGIKNFDYFVSYSRTQTDGDYEYTDNTGSKTKWKNSDTKADNIFVKGGYLFEDQSRLSAFYKYRKSDNGSPGSIDYPNYSARSKVDNNHISLSYEGLSLGPFAFNFNTYWMKRDHHYNNPESYLGLEENIYNSRALGVLVQAFTDLNKFGLLSYGYEFRQDKLECDNLVNGVAQPFIGNHQHNINSVYFQNDWKHDFDHVWKLTVVPAIRLDNYPEEGVGSQFSPKVGLTFSHDKIWRGSVRGNVGRVYRAPTYEDLYWPEDSWTVGNPDLKPEKGVTYDLGFIVQFAGLGSWSIESTYFGSKLDNLILWASGASGKWMPTNVAKANIYGIESKIAWRGFDDFAEIQASYTNMSAKDDSDDPATSGKYLIYRPKNKFDLTLNLNYEIASLNFYYNYVGKRFHDSGNTIEMDSYSLINANIGIEPKLFGINCNMKLELNNLGDKEIQATQGSPLPGREIRFSLGLKGSLIGL
ncbi:MAG: TonB-dependent receptor [Ignavibacteria bacterium]